MYYKTNKELIQAFRNQGKYVRFCEFLENCIEWVEYEDEVRSGRLPNNNNQEQYRPEGEYFPSTQHRHRS